MNKRQGLWQLELKLKKLRDAATDLTYYSAKMPYALYKSLDSAEAALTAAYELTQLIRQQKKEPL